MSDPLEFIPGYISPLTDKQHAQIGRIALLWGQIEHFVEHMLPHVSGLKWAELETLRVASQPIGQKVNFLRAATARLKDEDLRTIIKGFCTLIDDTKSSRNHIFHGIWGWRGDSKKKSVVPAARKTSQPEQPFRATQLGPLERKLCQCSRMGSDIMMLFWKEPDRVKLMRYFHHDSEETYPKWLAQWTERNSLDDALLDRNAKAGQLPRLAAPYPRT